MRVVMIMLNVLSRIVSIYDYCCLWCRLFMRMRIMIMLIVRLMNLLEMGLVGLNGLFVGMRVVMILIVLRMRIVIIVMSCCFLIVVCCICSEWLMMRISSIVSRCLRLVILF